nr:hypothetical protein [Martelella mediterranea]
MNLKRELTVWSLFSVRQRDALFCAETGLQFIPQLGYTVFCLFTTALQPIYRTNAHEARGVIFVRVGFLGNPDIAFAILSADKAWIARAITQIAAQLIHQKIDMAITGCCIFTIDYGEQIIALQKTHIIGGKVPQQYPLLAGKRYLALISVFFCREKIRRKLNIKISHCCFSSRLFPEEPPERSLPN